MALASYMELMMMMMMMMMNTIRPIYINSVNGKSLNYKGTSQLKI